MFRGYSIISNISELEANEKRYEVMEKYARIVMILFVPFRQATKDRQYNDRYLPNFRELSKLKGLRTNIYVS